MPRRKGGSGFARCLLAEVPLWCLLEPLADMLVAPFGTILRICGKHWMLRPVPMIRGATARA